MFDVRSMFAALRRSGTPADAYERGMVALERGHAEAARAAFEAAVGEAATARASAAARNKIGVALIALGRRDDALDAFCAALGDDERCAPALVNLGNLLLEDGDALDAVDYYEAALRADDRCAAAYRNLGVALRRLGRRHASVKALRKAAGLGSRRSRA